MSLTLVFAHQTYLNLLLQLLDAFPDLLEASMQGAESLEVEFVTFSPVIAVCEGRDAER